MIEQNVTTSNQLFAKLKIEFNYYNNNIIESEV